MSSLSREGYCRRISRRLSPALRNSRIVWTVIRLPRKVGRPLQRPGSSVILVSSSSLLRLALPAMVTFPDLTEDTTLAPREDGVQPEPKASDSRGPGMTTREACSARGPRAVVWLPSAFRVEDPMTLGSRFVPARQVLAASVLAALVLAVPDAAAPRPPSPP